MRDVRPIQSVEELAAPEIFESDLELDEFLAAMRANRDADQDRKSAEDDWESHRPLGRVDRVSFVLRKLLRTPPSRRRDSGFDDRSADA